MAPTIESISEDLAMLDDWQERYRYIIELGNSMPEFPEAARDDLHRVRGCVSQVWLLTDIGEGEDPILTFYGDSDAHIVRGLVAIAIAYFSGLHASEILARDADKALHRLGLDEHLTSQRSNGLRALIQRIRHEAESAMLRA